MLSLEICPLSRLGLFSKLLPSARISNDQICETNMQNKILNSNSHFGLGQIACQFQLAFSHLDNFLDKTGADFVLDIRDSNTY